MYKSGRRYKSLPIVYNVMDHFIRTVKSYPCLWDTEIEEYKTISTKATAWKCVCKQCGISDVREARHLWKKLRDGHRQAIKKRNSTGETCHGWKYEQQMAFLLPHIKKRPSTSEEYLIEHSEKSFQSLSDSDESKNSELSEQTVKKRKNIENHYFKTDVEEPSMERDILTEEILITEQENNSVKVFFESMSEMCKSLPEYTQIQVQHAVFNIVMDAREKNIKSNNL